MNAWVWVLALLAGLGLIGWRLLARRDGKAMATNVADSGANDIALQAAQADTPPDWVLALVELGFDETDSGARADAAQAAMLVDDARQALSGLRASPGQLPRRPGLLPQLMSLVNSEDSSGHEIAEVISRDPVLSSNLLKLVNSAAHCVQPAPVQSIERAVVLLGTQGIRRLIAVALMQPIMRTEGGALRRLPEAIWSHTQFAARAASLKAKHDSGDEDAFAAKLLMLLQGLGMIVVVKALRDSCACHGIPAPDDTTVAELLRSESPRIAIALAGEWEMPARMCDALHELQEVRHACESTGLVRYMAAAGEAGIEALWMQRANDVAV